MKKLTSLTLIFALLFCLSGCGDKTPSGKLLITVPEGFSKVEPGAGLTEQYDSDKNDGATINMVAAEPDESVKNLTKEDFAASMKQGLENSLGQEVDFEVVYFEGEEFLGCPGYSTCYKFSVMGLQFTHYQIAASTTDGSYVWTMSDITGDYADVFAAAVKSAVIQ